MPDWLASLSRLAEQDPTAVALADSSGQFSRAEVLKLVEAWSLVLARRGILPGDRVMLHLQPGIFSWVALLAVLAAGATAVPVSTRASQAELRRVARIWKLSASVSSFASPPVQFCDGGDNERRIEIECLPRRTDRRVSRSAFTMKKAYPFAARGQILLVGQSESGFLHEPSRFMNSARGLFDACRLVPEAAAYLSIPADHWAHLVCGFGFLAEGRPLWLAASPYESCILDLPVEMGPAICLTTASCWSRGLSRNKTRTELAQVRQLILVNGMVGSTMVRETRACLPEVRLDLIHGSVRCLATTHLLIGDDAPPPGCIGYPLPGMRIRVMRRKDREARPGRPGYLNCEVQLPSGDVGPATWPASSSGERPSRQDADGLEIGWRDHDGCLFQLPRACELIKTAGSVVVPTELEQRLLGSGLVDEALAIGVPHPELHEAVVLMVVPRPRVTPHQVRQFCLANMPAFMVPHRIELHHRLPDGLNSGPERDYLRVRCAGLFHL